MIFLLLNSAWLACAVWHGTGKRILLSGQRLHKIPKAERGIQRFTYGSVT